jgi:primosomal protein N' (replication factor Y)
VLHPDCRFDAHLLELTRWMADYYHCGWGEVLEAALPPSVRTPRAAVVVRRVSARRTSAELLAEASRVGRRSPSRAAALSFLAKESGPHLRAELLERAGCGAEVLRRLIAEGWAEEELEREERPDERAAVEPAPAGPRPADSRPELHADQEEALRAIVEAIEARAFRPLLIHGVTGSGKTEIYLRALRRVIDGGQRGLVLVPEISLTPQTVARFRSGLPGEAVAVLHSMLTPAERRGEWREIASGRARLVIGARSAVFAPARDLGLIVVDEEHDSSYKQESSPRYHARDVAVMRARMLGIPVLLGSATPTLETIWNARGGKYARLSLPRRVTSHDLPAITTEALGPEFYRNDGSGLITDALDYRLRKNLRAREQTILFLNRRGFATYLHCLRCAFVLKCPDCDITLTFHRGENAVRCHYCGHLARLPAACPDCHMPGLRRSGAGTEKITNELGRRYPEARVARLDRDTVGSYESLRSVLARFGAGEYDILVGTQMIAKGHDFPQVTLVGIVNADVGLHFPDFRSAERTFQLITQVAGRAGRGRQAGRVLIQTFFPDHHAVRCAAAGELEEFARRELEARRALGYPPFGRLVKIQFLGPEADKVAADAARAAEILRERGKECQVLGPAPSPIARIQGKHRFQVLLKSPSSRRLHEALAALAAAAPRRGKGVERAVDVDPQSML